MIRYKSNLHAEESSEIVLRFRNFLSQKLSKLNLKSGQTLKFGQWKSKN